MLQILNLDPTGGSLWSPTTNFLTKWAPYPLQIDWTHVLQYFEIPTFGEPCIKTVSNGYLAKNKTDNFFQLLLIYVCVHKEMQWSNQKNLYIYFEDV